MTAFKRNKPYRLVPLARLVLCKLYVAHVNDEPKLQHTAAEVAQLFTPPVSVNLASSALEFLRGETYSHPENRLVSRHKNPDTQNHEYRITQNGILLVERGLSNKDSDIAYFLEHGDSAIDDIAGVDAIFVSQEEDAEAEDRWEPLQIDRADATYQTAVQEVENALEIIRADNGFATSNPAERQGILATIENGLQWLKERAPTRSQLMSLLVSPLKWIAAKFGGALMGEAAKRAAQAVIDLLAARF